MLRAYLLLYNNTRHYRTELHVENGIHITTGREYPCDGQNTGEEKNVSGSRTRQHFLYKTNRSPYRRLRSNNGCWTWSVRLSDVPIVLLTNGYPIHGEVLEHWPSMLFRPDLRREFSFAVPHQSWLRIASNMQVRISIDSEMLESAPRERLVCIPLDELQADTTKSCQ